MLGNIVGINDSEILLKLNIDLNNYANLISMHVIMEDKEIQVKIPKIKSNFIVYLPSISAADLDCYYDLKSLAIC